MLILHLRRHIMSSIFASDFIINFDWSIFKFFEQLWNPVLNVIMSVITYLGDDGIFWIVLGLIMLIPKKTRKFGFYMLAGIAVAGAVNNLFIKNIVCRPRPFNFDGWPEAFTFPNIVAKPGSWSFPSGHTSSSFGAAFPMLMRAKKKYGIPAMVLALLIGISRIYVHVHYPTDIIAGIIVGILAGLVSTILCDKIFFPIIVPFAQKKWEEIKVKKA